MYEKSEGPTADSTAVADFTRDHQFLSMLMENITDSIYFKDRESRFLYISRALAEAFGLDDPRRAIGKTDFDFFSHEHARKAFEAEQEIILTGKSIIDLLEKETWPDGRITWASTTKMPFYSVEGDLIGTFGISRNVTQRKQMEEEQEAFQARLQHARKMEAIGQLAAGIAHEINTPTQYVSNNLSFLVKAFIQLTKAIEAVKSVDEQQLSQIQKLELPDINRLDFVVREIPRALDQSMEGLKRVTTIVNAMKSFAHPSDEAKQQVDLGEAIEVAVTLATAEWKHKANLELDIDPDLPLVPCVRDEINQAILNLIVNAAHAIESTLEPDVRDMGNIRITARHNREHAVIKISDDGCGIPEEVQSRIFDPFFTTKPLGKGTGQGLSLVHAIIVDKHAGELIVDSKPDEGTIFTIRLPLKEADVSVTGMPGTS